MESVFMARNDCRLVSPPPSQPHYCPTLARTLTRDEKNICLSPARLHQTNRVDVDSGSNETTPTTLWHVGVGGSAVKEGAGEEGGEGESSTSSSQYNEFWQSSSTVEIDTQMDGGGEGEGEGGGEMEREAEELEGRETVREGRGGNNVDGATGQFTIAKYIERFRSAPPTSREGRGHHQSGGTGNFWWQAPLHGPPGEASSNPSSPPLSQSTPTNSSTSTRQSLSSERGGEFGNSLEERSRKVLQKSHSLLTTQTAGSVPHARPATALPRHRAPSPPLPLRDGGVGEGEGDILYQWRLRRRLEQAHRHTAGLTARLGGGGPLFKSQSVRAGHVRGYHPTVHGGIVGEPADTEQPLPNTGHTPPDTISCRPCGQSAALPHHPQVAPPHHPPVAPTHHPPEALPHHPPEALPHHPPVAPPHHPPEAPPHHPPSLWCVPPHRHTVCDIVPCPHCHQAAHSPAPHHTRHRRKRVDESTQEITTLQEGQHTQEGKVAHPHKPPLEEDTSHTKDPQTAPAPQPPVRYPSPSLLDHMRRISQSHDNHRIKLHQHNEVESTEVSLPLSETFLSNDTSTSETGDHSPSVQCGVGDIVSQAVQHHLFQDWSPADESVVPAELSSEYDDMGDNLLKALVTRARTLEQQMRKVHTLLGESSGTQ